MNFDLPDILKLVAAILLIGAGIWQYRRRARDPENRYGSQSAVLLLTVGVILLVVALGGLDYRPSAGELGQ
ncbi:MAG TPA: hypothetical protein VM913_03515 [Sphingomicrobium sp.]|nr:hypothetical protein [Sphingomicrobium sp.]